MPRYFTLEQASQLLPSVEVALRRAVHLRVEAENVAAELQRVAQRVAVMGGVQLDRNQLLGVRSRGDALGRRLKETLEEIQGHGCQVKDLDQGLLDFPTLYRDREVLLCWKLGEPAITWWHGLEEGYRGRKPIDDEFLSNHRGDAGPSL